MTLPVKPLPAEDLDHILAHTRQLWPQARGQSFFITGGTGFFGMWLLESFAHANDALGLGMNAVVLSRNPAAFAAKAPHLAGRGDLRFIAGDMGSFDFPSGRFRYVIHAATEAAMPPPGTNPDDIRDAISGGTRRALAFATQAGTREFLYTSSGAVYGPQPPELVQVPEEYIGRPAAGYGEGKMRSEQLCLDAMARTGLAVKLARCFAFAGPHLPLDAHFAIGNFLRDALAGGPIRIAGDGTPTRSYLHAADLAVWLWTLLFAGASGRAYNVGSGDGRSIREIAECVRATLRPASEISVAKAAVPGHPVSRYVPDVSRAARELGLVPRIALEDAIRRTARWLVDLPLPPRVNSPP